MKFSLTCLAKTILQKLLRFTTECLWMGFHSLKNLNLISLQMQYIQFWTKNTLKDSSTWLSFLQYYATLKQPKDLHMTLSWNSETLLRTKWKSSSEITTISFKIHTGFNFNSTLMIQTLLESHQESCINSV